jgi:alkylated DNA repair protein (DNA oxidative demethylase)
MEQMSLLGAEPIVLPPGMKLFDEFLSRDEETKLLTHLRDLDWQLVRFRGVVAKRRVKHFGLDYLYNTREVSAAAPAPEWMKFVIERAAQLMNVEAAALQEILVSYYPAGSGIGWHRDAPMFGDAVFGVSLLSDTVMKFRRELDGAVAVGGVASSGRRKFETIPVLLKARGAYIFSGESRWVWQHHITGVERDRYSLTFRTLREQRPA